VRPGDAAPRRAASDPQLAEAELLTSAVRHDPDRVRALLAPDFVEIGRSGQLWDRESVIAALADEAPRPTPATDQWEMTQLTADLVLVTYVVHDLAGDSRHASVWQTDGDQPRLRFHQGTPLA